MFRRRNNRSNKRKAFSLLELAVIISVASITALGLLAWTTPEQLSDAQKYVQTRAKMKQIVEAIYTFRSNRERLPCPADPYQRSDDTRDSSGGTDDYVNSFGVEDLDRNQETVNGIKSLGIDCPNNIGAVPVYSLGLDSSMMVDAWQRRFTYQVSDNLCGEDQGTQVPHATVALTDAESIARGCTPQDYNDRVGDITITEAGTSNIITPKAAFVIVSHGPNGNGAFLPSGVQTSGASGDELINSNNTGGNKDNFVKGLRTASFDDIVVFKTRKTIEHLRRGREENRLSAADCESNTQTIRRLVKTDLDTMNTEITGLEISSGAEILNTGEEVSLAILMGIQDECIDLYGVNPGDHPDWPLGPSCPGYGTDPAADDGGEYDIATNSCSCPNGTWNNDCGNVTP